MLFTSLNADDEYFRRTGGTKPPPPPIESNRAKSISISGVTRHVLDATSDVVKVSKESEKQQLVGNNRVGPAHLSRKFEIALIIVIVRNSLQVRRRFHSARFGIRSRI